MKKLLQINVGRYVIKNYINLGYEFPVPTFGMHLTFFVAQIQIYY